MDSCRTIGARCAYGTGTENFAKDGDQSSPSEGEDATSKIEAVIFLRWLLDILHGANWRTIDGGIGYRHESAGF